MLPKSEYPIFSVTLPSGGTINMRPMVFKEEKILLMAKQSEGRKEVLEAVRQIINNCINTEGVNIDAFSLIDLEWTFIKLRAASISNIAKSAFKDNEDGKVYEFDVDLDKVVLKYPEQTYSDSVVVSDTLAIKLRQPPLSMYLAPDFFELGEEEVLDRVITSSIKSIFSGENSIPTNTYSAEDLKEFVNNLPAKSYAQFQSFFKSAPTLYYKIEYTNTKGTKRIIEMTSLDDFFIFV